MILTEIPTNELGRMMRERVTCVLRMGAVQLNLDWTAEFPPSQLLSCCGRMFEHLDCTVSFPKNVQRELICDLKFAPWLGRLMALAEKDAAAAETEDRPPSWSDLAQRLNELLEACRANGTSVAGYSEADVLFVLKQIDLTAGARLAYLENFAAMKLEDGGRAQIVKNLSACGTVPAALDDSRRALLAEPFVGTRYLFATADFEDVWNLFQFSPALADIARMLHEKDVLEYDFHEHPDAFPVADRVGEAEDREAVIAHFGAWLEENRLGALDGETFTIDTEAANRYFEGRFAAFQKAVSALQVLNETQFIHDHDWVEALIDNLGEAFTRRHGDYVLWGCDMIPTPLDEFLRKAQPGVRYCIGAVLEYTY